MRPIDELFVVPGSPKLVWLKILKYSTRNWRSAFSFMLKLRVRPMSQSM